MKKLCAEHIVSLVDLRWQLLGTDLTGKASLAGISLTQDMLDLVRMSPLQWGNCLFFIIIKIIYSLAFVNIVLFFVSPEIVINDQTVKAQDEITCNLGDCMTIGVGVSNALEHPLSDLTLSVSFYQDHQNGVNNYRLDTRLSIAGANKVMLPTVSLSKIKI